MTFFPMHFLGIAGMPRRIPNYPDIYINYNSFASLGSLISFLSVIAFIITMFSNNRYILPSLNSNSLDDAVQINRYNHLHSFNTVPVTTY